MKIEQRIDQAAQQCVKCGLCLPYCPTYVVAQNENESARGRIALMQGAVREQVPISELLTYHLDTCLACRACEAVCPAGVKYEELITTTRAWLNPKHKPSRLERFLIYLMEHPHWRRLFSKLIGIYQKNNWMRAISNKSSKIKIFSLANYVPATSAPRDIKHKNVENKKTALLLSPCASDVFDQRTINDGKKIIEHLGFQIATNKQDFCCGALSLHAGQLSRAQHCAKQQVDQWNELKPDIILSLASGCHSTLQEYSNSPLNVAVPNIPLQTIEEFALHQITLQEKKLIARPQRVVVHTPCTLRNGIRKPQLISQLLQQIPELTCIPIPASMGCCGAAGSYFFRHSDIAQKLVNPIVEFIREQQIDLWVTSNIGCALQIQHALKEAGINIRVLHPISLIAEQM